MNRINQKAALAKENELTMESTNQKAAFGEEELTMKRTI